MRGDVVAPVLNLHRPNTRLTYRRARSFLGFLRWLPYCLRERRVLRRKQVVADAELLAGDPPARTRVTPLGAQYGVHANRVLFNPSADWNVADRTTFVPDEPTIVM